eukprot:gi/632980712/ref/XP_007907187.1/ PREDICTED: zinc finger protein GLIS1 [Callorhinchus milii]
MGCVSHPTTGRLPERGEGQRARVSDQRCPGLVSRHGPVRINPLKNEQTDGYSPDGSLHSCRLASPLSYPCQSHANPAHSPNTHRQPDDTGKAPCAHGGQSCRWLDCSATYGHQEELVRHIEKVHIDQRSGEDFTCLWASCVRHCRPFNARYKLLIHMRVHSGEKPNKCMFEGCSKAFSRLENLKIHLRSHTGEKPYLCQQPGCLKAFSNSSDRAKHQRTHLHTKPYACRISGCTKRYTDPSSLRKHVKAHSAQQLPARRKLRSGLELEVDSAPDCMSPGPGHPTTTAPGLGECHVYTGMYVCSSLGPAPLAGQHALDTECHRPQSQLGSQRGLGTPLRPGKLLTAPSISTAQSKPYPLLNNQLQPGHTGYQGSFHSEPDTLQFTNCCRVVEPSVTHLSAEDTGHGPHRDYPPLTSQAGLPGFQLLRNPSSGSETGCGTDTRRTASTTSVPTITASAISPQCTHTPDWLAHLTGWHT